MLCETPLFFVYLQARSTSNHVAVRLPAKRLWSPALTASDQWRAAQGLHPRGKHVHGMYKEDRGPPS